MAGGEQDVFRLLEPLIRSQGLDLVEVRFAGAQPRPILRIVLHSPEGVSLGDCARVTRAAGEAIEESGVVSGRYVLEVSSSGVDRVLKAPREFDVFRGRRVRVRVADGDPVEIVGTADGSRGGDSVAVRGEDGGESLIEWARIRKARLVPDTPARRDGGGS